MSKAIRKVLMLTLTLAMAICMVVAGATSVFATDGALSKQVADVTLTMGSGAEVRIIGQDDKDNGLRFSATISAEDYEGLKANADYQKVTFGIVIVPAEWTEIYELTEENLFGTDAKYCWDGAQAGKAEIINLEANTLTKNADGNYFLKGSIVGLQDYNIGRAFTARAYAKAVDADGNASYKMANWFDGNKANNVRSMTEVALAAIADTSEDAISDDEKAILKKIYVAKSVPVNYYFETAESSGEYDLGATTYVSGSNGQTVYANIDNIYEGYSLNTSIEGTVISTVVDENNGNEALSVYYEKIYTSFTSNNKDGYSAVCIGLPEGAQRGDAYSVSFKLKVNGPITTNAYGGAFIRAFSAFNVFTGNDQTYTAAPDGWVEVIMPNVVCVTAYDVYDWIVVGLKRQLNAPTLDTSDNTTVGIYLLGFNVDNGTTIEVKDVVISDADYSFTSNNKDGYSAVCIGLPEGAQRGDAYSVSFKLKVNGPITTNAYGGAYIRAFSAFNAFTGNDQIYTAAPDGWVEVTMPNVVCVTAHDVYDWIVLGAKRALNAPTLDTSDNTTVGIYLLGFNVDNGTTIEVKDVMFEKVSVEEETISFTSNSKDGYSAVCIGLPEGAQRGDAYSVSFKLKVNGTITPNVYGGAYIRAFSAFNAFTGNDQIYTAAPDGWVEVTMPNVVCVTAHDVYDWIVLGFKRALNAPTLDTSDSTTVGIYLLGFNVDNGTTIEVKDIVITAIA